MRKVLQETGSRSLPGLTETNPKDHVKSISTTVEADTTSIRRIGTTRYALRRNKVEDLGLTIEEGEVIDEPMEDIVKTRNDDNEISFEHVNANFFSILSINVMSKVVEDMDAYRDQDMGEIIVGNPFCREIYVKARRFEGMLTIYNGNDSVTYQMARSHPRFKHLTNAQCNKMRPLMKVSARDKLNGILRPYQKLKSFYKGVLNLGPEYIRDAKIEEWLTRGHVSIHEME
ncbi:hypothetical protein Tco_1143920 [Tanacetum coccineum]